MNLPEEASEPVLEELAVRFKTEETAKIFEHVVLQCIERLGSSEQGMCIHFWCLRRSYILLKLENKFDWLLTFSGEENSTEVTESEALAGDAEDNEYEVEEGDGYYGEEDYDELYDGQQYYVDEHGIQDAMTEIMFDGHAKLTIVEDGSSADYDGVIRLIRGNVEAPEDEHDEQDERVKSFLQFSTPDVPSLYTAEINKDSQTLVSSHLLLGDSMRQLLFLSLLERSYHSSSVTFFWELTFLSWFHLPFNSHFLDLRVFYTPVNSGKMVGSQSWKIQLVKEKLLLNFQSRRRLRIFSLFLKWWVLFFFFK